MEEDDDGEGSGVRGNEEADQRLSCRRKMCGLFSCVWVRATKLKKG